MDNSIITDDMPYYVSMTDKFLSGWGFANGRKSVLVIECDTLEQAEQIERAATERPEMKYVRIRRDFPCSNNRRFVSHKHWDDLGKIWKGFLS